MKQATISDHKKQHRRTLLLLLTITLLAFFLRIYQLESAPPGWRDDELINSLVISQKVLDGDWAVYYPDASGHEALYHILNAFMLALFGPGTAGIRLLSVILGTLTVPLTYLVGARLFGRKAGLLAAALLAVSFWSLMYSRIGIRHISLPVFMLPAFYFFLRGVGVRGDLAAADEYSRPAPAVRRADFLLCGLFMGLGFYTYFASRGIVLILLAFCIYIWLFQRWRLRGIWRNLLLTFALAAILAIPLMVTLGRQPESEARVEELAVPVTAARDGDFGPLVEHVGRTLSMFHADGDEEWLYNIPFRPVFGLLPALFFWAGVAIASWYTLKPIGRFVRRERAQNDLSRNELDLEAAGAFLLIWWLAGISPGFVSVPAASLGHTIIAQSAAYILVTLPVLAAGRLLSGKMSASHRPAIARLAPLGLALLLLASVAWRDLPDYFSIWPERGMTRFLYRAEVRILANYLNDNPDLTDIAVGGYLAGPWDRLALTTDLQNPAAVRVRWFNPKRAIILATAGQEGLTFRSRLPGPAIDESSYEAIAGMSVGAHKFYRVNDETSAAFYETVCFQNGLCALQASYDADSGSFSVTWEVDRPLDLPESPLISNPPPPGVYAGPRLLAFAQLLDAEGQVLVGDDGFWVDASTLYPGDRFRQTHFLSRPSGALATAIVFGLYDPMTGDRYSTQDGRDHVELQLGN